MNPLLAAVNRTPRFTALVSFASAAPVGVPSCQMLHGHARSSGWAGQPVQRECAACFSSAVS